MAPRNACLKLCFLCAALVQCNDETSLGRSGPTLSSSATARTGVSVHAQGPSQVPISSAAASAPPSVLPVTWTPPAPDWLAKALRAPAHRVQPSDSTCIDDPDRDGLLAASDVALHAGTPKRITILVNTLYGMGSPCYQRFGTGIGDALPQYVSGLPGRASDDILPPRVHGGAFTFTGYFTGRLINTRVWYVTQGVPNAVEDEGEDYDELYPEFVIEGWCFHPPDLYPGMEELFRESIADMRKRGIPFCAVANRCEKR